MVDPPRDSALATLQSCDPSLQFYFSYRFSALISFIQVLSVSINPGGVSYIRVGEQNQENDIMWPGDYADELSLKVEAGSYTITHPDADLELDGWLRCFPEQATARDEWRRCNPLALLL